MMGRWEVAKPPGIEIMGPNGRISEYYHALLRNLRLDGNGSASHPQTMGVSAVEGCSPSSVLASNLAICMASANKRGPILLVNANPRNQAPEKSFELVGQPGVYDVIDERCSIDEAICETSIANLFAIGSGQRGSKGVSVSCLNRFRTVLSELKERFAGIVVDLPTANELTPCFAMAAQLDGVVVGVESSRVDGQAAQAAIQRLRVADAQVLGCVFMEADG